MAQKNPPYVLGIHQRKGGLEIVVSNYGRVRLDKDGLLTTDDHGVDVEDAEPRQRKRHGNDEGLIGDSNGRLHICPNRTIDRSSRGCRPKTREPSKQHDSTAAGKRSSLMNVPIRGRRRRAGVR